MTEQCRQQIDYTLATLAIEGMIPGEETIHLCERMDIEGLSADEAVKILFAQYDVNRNPLISR